MAAPRSGSGAAPGASAAKQAAPPARACRVPGCSAPLAPGYSCKYRICVPHYKASSMRLPGADGLVRFCQQCGKFEALAVFEGERRSCRASLDKHKHRRRRAEVRRGQVAEVEGHADNGGEEGDGDGDAAGGQGQEEEGGDEDAEEGANRGPPAAREGHGKQAGKVDSPPTVTAGSQAVQAGGGGEAEVEGRRAAPRLTKSLARGSGKRSAGRALAGHGAPAKRRAAPAQVQAPVPSDEAAAVPAVTADRGSSPAVCAVPQAAAALPPSRQPSSGVAASASDGPSIGGPLPATAVPKPAMAAALGHPLVPPAVAGWPAGFSASRRPGAAAVQPQHQPLQQWEGPQPQLELVHEALKSLSSGAALAFLDDVPSTDELFQLSQDLGLFDAPLPEASASGGASLGGTSGAPTMHAKPCTVVPTGAGAAVPPASLGHTAWPMVVGAASYAPGTFGAPAQRAAPAGAASPVTAVQLGAWQGWHASPMAGAAGSLANFQQGPPMVPLPPSPLPPASSAAFPPAHHSGPSAGAVLLPGGGGLPASCAAPACPPLPSAWRDEDWLFLDAVSPSGSLAETFQPLL